MLSDERQYYLEGDGTAATASMTTLWTNQLHNLSSRSGQDWIKFEAQAGITYTLQTSGLGTTADTYLFVYDQDGTTLYITKNVLSLITSGSLSGGRSPLYSAAFFAATAVEDWMGRETLRRRWVP